MLNVVLIAHLTYKNQWGEWHTKKTEFIRNDFDSLSIVALLEQKKEVNQGHDTFIHVSR